MQTIKYWLKLFLQRASGVRSLEENITLKLEQLQQLSQTIPVLEEQLQQFSQKIPALEGQIQQLSQKAPVLEEQLQQLSQKVPSLEEQLQLTNQKVPELDKQLQSINQKVPELDKQLQSINQKVPELEGQFQPIHQRFNKTQHGKPSEVVLWGMGVYSQSYMKCLNEAGIKIKGWVCEEKLEIDVENIQVLSPQDYVENFFNYQHIPLVIIDLIDEQGNDLFKQHLLKILNYQTINPKILHPVFIADFLHLDYSDKVFQVGFPGSGNMTLQAILEKIMAQKIHRRPGFKEEFIASLASTHHFNLVKLLNDFMEISEQDILYLATQTKDSCCWFLEIKPLSKLHIYGLQTKNYLYEKLHVSHEIIDGDMFSLFKDMNYTLFLQVRNPMDILVSVAKKYSSHPSLPTALLKDLDWFEEMASLVKNYYEKYLEKGKAINLVRYEDLIGNPLQTIKQVAEKLQVNLNDIEAQRIWNEVGFKKIASDDISPNHYWRPGAGKWKEYFTDKHLEILKSLHYRDLLEDLGYEGEMHFCPKAFKPCELPQDNDEIAIEDYRYHKLYGTPIHFRNDRVKSKWESRLGIGYVSNDERLWSLVSNSLESRLFQKYMLALDPLSAN